MYDVLFNTGRIARRNRVHLKNDQTSAHSEPGTQKPLERNSELGQQKPLQRNSELGPQKPLQRNSEPVMQKPICELLPPQPEADTSDSSVVEEQALTGPDDDYLTNVIVIIIYSTLNIITVINPYSGKIFYSH